MKKTKKSLIKHIYHITKTDSGWQAKKEGNKKATAVAKTKKEVKKTIISKAKKQGSSSVVIHKAEGQIQEERTYPRKADPRKSRG